LLRVVYDLKCNRFLKSVLGSKLIRLNEDLGGDGSKVTYTARLFMSIRDSTMNNSSSIGGELDMSKQR